MNNSDLLRPGIISVISGCMFSGKTDELIRRLSVLRHTKKEIIVFKPVLDERYLVNSIVAHRKQNNFVAHCVKNTAEIVTFIENHENNKKIDVIAFDEVQFLPLDLFVWIEKWVKMGKIIICAGLDKDYWNQYNSLMSRLLVRAELVIKLTAVCDKCSRTAYRTQRMKNNQPVSYYEPKILIAGKENYQARCSSCYKYFPEK